MCDGGLVGGCELCVLELLRVCLLAEISKHRTLYKAVVAVEMSWEGIKC